MTVNRKHRRSGGGVDASHIVRKATRDEEGQSTVEYALVALAIIAIVVCMSSLVGAVRRGAFSNLAVHAASHALSSGGAVEALADIFMF